VNKKQESAMIFSCSIGSEGVEEESFSINFPLILSPGKMLNIDSINSFEMSDGLLYSLEKHHYLYSLKVERFSTVEDARIYTEKLLSSLRWASLKNKLGIRFPTEIHEPKMADTPINISEHSNIYKIVNNKGWTDIDGNYHVEKLTIIPEHKKLMRWESGHPSITLGLNPENFFNDINESISFQGLDNIHSEKKLCLAIELYSAYQFEVSSTAKFVKLVTVIESLLPDLEIPEEMIPILECAKKVLKDEREAAKSRRENTESIEHLLSRLGGLKQQSIGSTMELFISNCLDDFPELGDKDVMLPRVKDLYNTRSILLHDGEFEDSVLREGIEILGNFVPNLLTKLYIRFSS
jgi:hypothetical protein